MLAEITDNCWIVGWPSYDLDKNISETIGLMQKKSSRCACIYRQRKLQLGQKEVNLCLDEKQDRVLKPHQLSCIGGSSGGGGMMGRERS